MARGAARAQSNKLRAALIDVSNKQNSDSTKVNATPQKLVRRKDSPPRTPVTQPTRKSKAAPSCPTRPQGSPASTTTTPRRRVQSVRELVPPPSEFKTRPPPPTAQASPATHARQRPLESHPPCGAARDETGALPSASANVSALALLVLEVHRRRRAEAKLAAVRYLLLDDQDM